MENINNCFMHFHRDRVRDLKRINQEMNLPKTLPYRKSKKFQLTGSGDFTDNFDCVFWCGDLNFRLEQSREVVMREVEGQGCHSFSFSESCQIFLNNEKFTSKLRCIKTQA